MRPLTLSIAALFVSVFSVCALAQTAGPQISTAGASTTLAALPAQSQQTAEVLFNADNQDERDAGVWIDGKYYGFVKELKGDKKVLLPPGEHEISIREDGYKDLVKKLTLAPGDVQTLDVVLEENPKSIYPGDDAAELRLDIQPKRSAVFIDGAYVGHGGDFGGHFHSMLVAPGKHQLKVTLNGYRTYETQINPVANEKSRMKIVLEKGDDSTAKP
ncbi:MAG TPA: PEGA domain-containing protein [Candidatus Acidoferrales bacterium]|nr:PEGA domain-containing protein [Candidatus Acidoferrales bacterium]